MTLTKQNSHLRLISRYLDIDLQAEIHCILYREKNRSETWHIHHMANLHALKVNTSMLLNYRGGASSRRCC